MIFFFNILLSGTWYRYQDYKEERKKSENTAHDVEQESTALTLNDTDENIYEENTSIAPIKTNDKKTIIQYIFKGYKLALRPDYRNAFYCIQTNLLLCIGDTLFYSSVFIQGNDGIIFKAIVPVTVICSLICRSISAVHWYYRQKFFKID